MANDASPCSYLSGNLLSQILTCTNASPMFFECSKMGITSNRSRSTSEMGSKLPDSKPAHQMQKRGVFNSEFLSLLRSFLDPHDVLAEPKISTTTEYFNFFLLVEHVGLIKSRVQIPQSYWHN